MDSMRPAVPAPPPAYNTIHKVTAGRSLRPIVLFCTLCSFIWSLCIGIAYVKEMFKEGVSGRLMAMYIIQAVFFLFLALLELVGFYAAWRQQIRAGKLYTLLVIVGGVLVIVAESIRLALHFVFKTDIQSACAVQNRDDEEYVSAASIAEWCNSRWKNGIWRDVAWIVFGAICSVFMYILAKAYLHQLLDPNFGRRQAASGRYQMNPIETHHMPYSHSSGQDPPFVPPYGAPPHMAPGYAAPPTYDAPAYTPPEKGYNVSDSKATASERDAERDSAQGGDLAGSNPFGRSDSEVTLQGREREGRI